MLEAFIGCRAAAQ